MDNFKRFLTYINSYSRGELIRNVGSSKIELRDNICRITVNAKDLMNIDVENAYLFRRENTNMVITYLGKLSYSNGNYELRVETNGDNVLNTGYGFQEFAGVMLLREENVGIIEKPQQIYAGIWDNKPLGKTISNKSIQVEAVREVTYKKEKSQREVPYSPSLIEKIGNLVNTKKDKLAMTSTDSSDNDNEVIPEDKKDIETQNCEDLKKNDVTNIVVKEEVEIVESKEIEEEGFDSSTDDISTSDIGDSDNEPATTFVGGNKEEEAKDMNITNVVDQDFVHLKNTVEFIDSNQTNETIIGNVESNVCVDDKIDCMNIRMEKAEELREKLKDEKKKECSEAESKVRYIMQAYPKMNPFEDGCECVRIEPQDLYGLPISIWMPVNNNFLKNGYSKFKHLVLTKNGNDYVVGVPGIKNEKEQFMAYLHGFTVFKPLIKLDNVTEEFGYWVVKINI